MRNRQITALVAAALTAALVVPIWGLDVPADKSSTTTASAPATGPGDPRRHAMRDAERERLIFDEDRLTDDKIEEVLAFAKKHFPEEHNRIETLRKEDPRQAQRALRRLWWLYKNVRHLPPEVQAAAAAMHRLNVIIFQTRRELLQTEEASKKAELTRKLQTLLGEQFDNDQIVKEYQIKRLSQQLADLKAEIEQRKTNRQKIIAERLERLLKPRPDTMQPPGPSTRPSPPMPASPRERNVEKDN